MKKIKWEELFLSHSHYLQVNFNTEFFIFSLVFEDNQNNIFFYQSNDSLIEPHFDIIYKNELIFLHSGKDNLFEAIVFFLLTLKYKMDKLEKKLNIEDFSNIILKS